MRLQAPCTSPRWVTGDPGVVPTHLVDTRQGDRRLLERAREDGRLREDFDVFDVPMLHLMLGAVADATREVAPELWRRYLGIFLDGMRAKRDAPTPLPCEPLDADRYAIARAPRTSAARSR